eukprot:scaffold65825_cov17-Tisochrysis_lutea.AAC.1
MHLVAGMLTSELPKFNLAWTASAHRNSQHMETICSQSQAISSQCVGRPFAPPFCSGMGMEELSWGEDNKRLDVKRGPFSKQEKNNVWEVRMRLPMLYLVAMPVCWGGRDFTWRARRWPGWESKSQAYSQPKTVLTKLPTGFTIQQH